MDGAMPINLLVPTIMNKEAFFQELCVYMAKVLLLQLCATITYGLFIVLNFFDWSSFFIFNIGYCKWNDSNNSSIKSIMGSICCCNQNNDDKGEIQISNNPKPKVQQQMNVGATATPQEYQSLQNELRETQKKCKNLERQRDALQAQLQHFNASVQGIGAQRDTLISQQAKLQGQIQGLKRHIAQKDKTINEIKSQLQRATNNYEAQKHRSASNQLAFSNLSKQAQDAEMKRKEIEPKLKQLQQRLKREQNDYSYTIKQLQGKTRDSQSLKSQVASLQAQLTQVIADRDRVKNELQRAKDEVFDLKRRLADIQIKSQEQTKTITALRREIDDMQYLKQQNQEGRRSSGAINNWGSFFVGDVLDGEDDYKDYLISILQQRLKTNITGTRLLYRYDPLNKANFHQYIDNHDNIVIVVKLKNGFAVAAWSEGSFYPKMVSDKDGLLFSLTNRKVFEPLKANSRVINYDEFFLIFGNSQLRLKSNEKKVFSNFGVNNGYFANRGERIDVLLGGSVREVELENYEIFQLKFK